MEGKEHKSWEEDTRAATRRTTITGSPVEQIAFRHFLAFLPDEQFAKVSVSPEELSILTQYSWVIPPPAQTGPTQLGPFKPGPFPSGPPLPMETVLNALKSTTLRQEYYFSMAPGYDFDTVQNALDRLLNELVKLGVEGARALELGDLATVVIDDGR